MTSQRSDERRSLVRIDFEGYGELGLSPEYVDSRDLDLVVTHRCYSTQSEEDLVPRDLVADPTSLPTDDDAYLLIIGVGECDREGLLT